jgi:hypothetical protein
MVTHPGTGSVGPVPKCNQFLNNFNGVSSDFTPTILKIIKKNSNVKSSPHGYLSHLLISFGITNVFGQMAGDFPFSSHLANWEP